MKHIKNINEFIGEQQYADHRMEYAGEDVSKELGL